jgi:hypothetical protein
MPTKKSPGVRPPKPTDAEQVAAWMAAIDHPLKDGIQRIRECIASADPRIGERIKWNAPSYHLEGTDIVTFGPRRGDKVLLVFHHPAIVGISSDLLEGDFKDRRLAWFGSMEEIEAGRAEVLRIVRAVVAEIDATQ